jgi:hypothetical protein
MVSESPSVTALVSVIRRYFEHDATRDEVRVAVHEVCLVMHSGGIAPQTMLVTLKAAVQTAALEARAPVSRDSLRAVTSDLTPWMIDVCFSPESSIRRSNGRGL